MLNKVALTSNGNQYKKTNMGKVVGNAPSIVLLAASGLAATKNIIKHGSPNINKRDAASFFIILGLMSTIGTTIGAIVDRCINHDRQSQADGEAKLNQNV